MGGIDFPNGISTDRRIRCRRLPAESCYFRRLIQEIDSSGGGLDNPTLQFTSKISAPPAPHVS